MDKRLIFAVAGSGKTTYIVDSLSTEKRTLILTYTTGNYENLTKKIATKFGGVWPENIQLMRYFPFLYRFCYKPFLSDSIKAKGIVFFANSSRRFNQNQLPFFLYDHSHFYSNRLAFFLEKQQIVKQIQNRIEEYFDELIIDEVQDIAGRDFNFLELLMETNVNMLFVGDFYQHTFDTSRDGSVNKSLFDDRAAYEARFTRKGFITDTTTLVNSWRCGRKICEFITDNLGINISSNRKECDDADVYFISDPSESEAILNDPAIIKLHFQKCNTFGSGRRNWGDTKGEDNHNDVCVMLNHNTAILHESGRLHELAPRTRNKLYVAITRAHGNVYMINERENSMSN